MILSEDENQDIWHKGTDDETPIDGYIGEHDEPEVSCSRLQFARCFGCCDTACGIFPSNTYTDEETICGKSSYHAIESSAAIGPSTERCEDDHDNGGNN